MINEDKQLKLTISILASNRKDTLPKCLESLRPLLEQVSSELIITDTGCDEDLLAYIRQYTDRIVKFQWCNDFAVARNVGLNMARGQWFMYIDDDEWFEDVSELVDFFNGDEEKDYVAANYLVRNYRTFAGDTYNESVAGRVFRIKPGIQFMGKVHEYIYYDSGKEKQLFSFVHHYGYAFVDEKKKRLHCERNMSLLKEEIDREPSKARNYAHLYQEFKTLMEPDEALIYAFKALECVVENTKENMFAMCSTYACVLWAYYFKDDFDNVIKWGKEFLRTKPITSLTQAAIASYMAEAYNSLGDYANGMKAIDEYVRLLELYRIDKARYYSELGPMLNVLVTSRSSSLLSIGLEMAIKTKDILRATEYLDAFEWYKDVQILNKDCLNGLIVLMASVDRQKEPRTFLTCVRVLGKLFTNIEVSRVVMKAISDLKEKNIKGYENVYIIMSNVAGQWGYNDLVKLIAANKKNNTELLVNMYKNIVNGERSILGMDKVFYEIACDRNISIDEMIKDIPIDRWSIVVGQWLAKMQNRDLVLMKKYFDVLLSKESDYMKIFDGELITVLNSRKK